MSAADLPRCPRCRGGDLLVVAVANYPGGRTALDLLCASCSTEHPRLEHAAPTDARRGTSPTTPKGTP